MQCKGVNTGQLGELPATSTAELYQSFRYSREEALRLFQQVPFFAAWDSEALEIYVEHGLAPDPKGGFRLKMSGLQEAIVFVEARVPREVWELLESLDDRVELRWIMPGDHGAISKP